MGNTESRNHDNLWKKKQSYYDKIQKLDTILEPCTYTLLNTSRSFIKSQISVNLWRSMLRILFSYYSNISIYMFFLRILTKGSKTFV